MKHKVVKAWFKWSNAQMQRVFIYEDFEINGELCHRAKSGKRHFVLKESDKGKTWAYEKEELENV